MENIDDRYLIPFTLGSELTTESFRLAQNDNTYMLAAPRYYQFYASFIRPRIAMYRGWIQNFHNLEYGVIPSLFLQKIGKGITSTLFNKPFILNSKDPTTNAITESKYKKSNFENGVKEAYDFAIEGGTGLIKWNKDGLGNLRLESVPMDKFFIQVDAYGDIESVKSFLATYHDTARANYEYYLCEERFFRYVYKNGERKRYPFVHYLVYKTSSNITNEYTPKPTDAITYTDIPYDIRQLLKRDYGDIWLDTKDGKTLQDYSNCKLLPFDDDLGCRLLKFTRGIPAYPKLPFGQPIADLLMNESYAYDQLKFFERLEVYISRGRIMIDKRYVNPNDMDSRKKLLDPLVFTFYDSFSGEGDDKKPEGMQLELRSDAISRQKQNILNDAAFSLNLSSTTIASWLSDGTTQKTALEVEYERTKTSAFISDKLELIKQPLQEMIDIYYYFYGVKPPELNIMPENQTVRSENIRLYSELYDKGQVTAEMLAKEILGTCSLEEVENLANFIKLNAKNLAQGGKVSEA